MKVLKFIGVVAAFYAVSAILAALGSGLFGQEQSIEQTARLASFGLLILIVPKVGYRRRDVLFMLIPFVNAYFFFKWLWRFSSLPQRYWERPEGMDESQVGVDVIRDPRRKTRERLLATIVLALVLLVVGDWYTRNVELERLIEAVEASEKVMVEGRDTLDAASRQGVSRIEAADFFERAEVRRTAIREIEGVASDAAAELLPVISEIKDLGILPWHGQIRKARSTYLEHADQWLMYFEDVARDVAAAAEERPRLGATFEIAERAFAGSVPTFPLFNLEARIQGVFAE